MFKKSILWKILISISIPVILVFIAAHILILNSLEEPLSKVNENEIKAQSYSASYQVSEYFTKYIEIVKQMSTNTDFAAMFESTVPGRGMSEAEHFPEIMETLKNIGATDEHIDTAWLGDFDASQLIQSDGAVRETGWDITSRPFYDAIKTTTDIILTEPYQDSKTQQWIISVINPMYQAAANKLIGISCVDIEISQLDVIMSNYSLGKNGYFILVTADGQIIHHPNKEFLNKNISEVGFSENLVSNIQSNTEGSVKYTDNGESYIGYVSKVGKTGWVVLGSLPLKEFNQTYNAVKGTTFFIFSACILILIGLIILVSRGIIRPIKKLANIANKIADGQMDLEQIQISDTEIGQVEKALGKTVYRLRQYIQYINEISETLNQIAEGNLNFELKYEYTGEFQKIKDALLHISRSLNDTLKHINQMAIQVSNTSNHIASDAEALSQSTMQQEMAVQELSNTITEISGHINENAANSEGASKRATELGSEIIDSNQQMQQLIVAMNEITNYSSEIEKIIKTIEDIAFQTNILALNAAVEAARAGTAGKGFAVVADEVRNLAGKSGEAAKNTTELIDGTLKAVDNGAKIAGETAKSLEEIVGKARETVEMIDKISLASSEQANSINQVTQGVEQISSVVKTNAASAEKSDLAVRELTGQAESLRNLLNKFHLQDQ